MNKTGTVTIETPRLILRRLSLDDAEAMYQNWATDPDVTKYLTWQPHANIDVTRQVLNAWVTRYDDGSSFIWGIVLKNTQTLIGTIAVVRFDERTESAVIGYCMSKAYWGQGIMPEALKAVMDYLFDVVGFNRVAANHDINNPKSGRVMQKAGMKYEGVLRQAGVNNQGIIDEVWYAMIKSDRETSPQDE